MQAADSLRQRAALPNRLWRALWGRGRPPLVPTLIILTFIILAIAPGLFAPQSPVAMSLPDRLKPPFWIDGGSTRHILGSDQLGRDILSRIVHGARVSLTVGLLAVLGGGAIGLFLGMIAGYAGGWVDVVLMRLVDGVLAIPWLLIALTFAITLGPSERNLIIIIALFSSTHYARVLRSDVLSVKSRQHVLAARILGASRRRILLRHILPHIGPTLIVLLTLQIGSVIIAEASLSFLGAGIPPPAPAWGSMVSEGRDLIARAWWVSFFPGLAIALVVLAFNLFGDWLRDRLDPRLTNA